jgi:hypothetical protein
MNIKTYINIKIKTVEQGLTAGSLLMIIKIFQWTTGRFTYSDILFGIPHSFLRILPQV